MGEGEQRKDGAQLVREVPEAEYGESTLAAAQDQSNEREELPPERPAPPKENGGSHGN